VTLAGTIGRHATKTNDERAKLAAEQTKLAPPPERKRIAACKTKRAKRTRKPKREKGSDD
jgi:hypothetical protein